MKITEKARQLLEEVLVERQAEGIRIYFAGYGWGGPRIGLALDGPEEGDLVKVENGIQVAVDSRIASDADGLTLEYDPFQDGLIILGGSEC